MNKDKRNDRIIRKGINTIDANCANAFIFGKIDAK